MPERHLYDGGDPLLSGPVPGAHHHVLIGGTGRAGTSFLVRYLTELGLETTFSRQGDQAVWDDQANAGLEEGPDPSFWPYVVKTPWLYQFIDRLLATNSVQLDAVIIPVRPLQEAAASRVILELRSIHQGQPWMAHGDAPWTEWGMTAGGCLMSLEPLDQARLLATGFYGLVERLVRAEVPVILVAFPRLAEDPDYLFAKLAPVLPGVTVEQASAAHARTADPAKVRVGGEFAPAIAVAQSVAAEANLAALNGIALRREVVRLRAELAAMTSHRQAEVTQLRGELQAGRAQLEAAAGDLIAKDRQIARLQAEVAGLATQNAGIAGNEDEVQAVRAALLEAIGNHSDEMNRARNELARVVAANHAIRSSTSWRLTAPLRRAGRRIPASARARLATAFNLILRPRFFHF